MITLSASLYIVLYAYIYWNIPDLNKIYGTLMCMLLTSFCKGMKIILLLPILIGVSAECDSQERQLFVGVNTGLFKYDHNIPDDNQSEPFYSMLNVNTFRLDIPESIYPNNPRGNKVAFSYSFNLA